MESSAIDPSKMSMESLRNEAAKPNALMVFAEGAVSGNRVQMQQGTQMAQAQVDLMRVDMEYINNGSGVNSDNLGNQTNAVSGVAIDKRQREGQVTTTEPFDNIHSGYKLAGKLKLALVEQYYLAPRDFRLEGKDGKPHWLSVNQFDEQSGEYKNDLTRFSADFIMDEQAWRAALAQSAMENLWELLGQLAQVDPQVVIAALDLIVEQEPHLPPDVKQRFLTRIRDMRGLSDPDKVDDPEEIAKQEQIKQDQARVQQQAEAAQQAKTDKDRASAEKDMSHVASNRASATRNLMDTIRTALEIAQSNGLNMDISEGADELLASANFPGNDPVSAMPGAQQPAAQPVPAGGMGPPQENSQ